MGGHGSGRYYRGYGKTKVEDCHKVDANDFAKWKFFKPGMWWSSTRWTRGGREIGSCGVQTKISDNQALCVFQYDDREVHVNLSSYAPGFGGRRYFFVCPICGRRMRTLHFRSAEIACRICHDLTYESCNESHYFDSLYKHMAAGLGHPWQDVKWIMSLMKRQARKEPKRPRGRPRNNRSSGG